MNDDILERYYGSSSKCRPCLSDLWNQRSEKSLKRKKENTICISSCSDIDDGKIVNTSNNTNTNGNPNRNNDDLIAKELNALTIQEREEVFEDLHGVSKPIEENNTFLIEKLNEMNTIINTNYPKTTNKKNSIRTAYDRALFLGPKRVLDYKFKLMFLRSERFNCNKAVIRMFNYFTYKLELFGEDKLIKTITLDDMSADDIECINSGSIQILSNKYDNSGRGIIFITQNFYNYKSWKNQMKLCWYILMTAIENNVQYQKNGFVDIVYNVGITKHEKSFNDMLSKTYLIRDGIPFRIVALHYCYDNILLRPAMSLIQLIIGRDVRLRFRAHFGTHVECMYSLLSFGIPIDCGIPIDFNGNKNESLFNDFITKQKVKEKVFIENELKLIDYPLQNDILLGRGKPYQDFYGNTLLSKYIDSKRSLYFTFKDRSEKTKLAKNIVQYMKQTYNCRFLQRIEIKNNNYNKKLFKILNTNTNTNTNNATTTTTTSNNNNTSDNNTSEEVLKLVGGNGSTNNNTYCSWKWEEVSDTVAREKVSHGLRTKPKPSKQEKRGGSTTSTTTTTASIVTSDSINTNKEIKKMRKSSSKRQKIST